MTKENGKKWYTSKTLWLNVLGIVAIVLQTQIGFVLSAELQTSVLAILNVVLRIVTKEPIHWK